MITITKKKMIVGIVLLCLGGWIGSASAQNRVIDSLVGEYDKIIGQADQYFALRERRIDSLRTLPNGKEKYMQIAQAYASYQGDSALRYYELVARDTVIGQVEMVYYLASMGCYTDAIEQLKGIDTTQLDGAEGKVDYCRAVAHLYAEAAQYCKSARVAEQYKQWAEQYEKQLLGLLGREDVKKGGYYRLAAVVARREGRYESSLCWIDSAMRMTHEREHFYAIMAYERAITYREMGEEEEYVQWLLRSAITDVYMGVANNGSAWMVAEWMYKKGDLERSYTYIDYALKNANFFNGRLRGEQVNPLSNMISKSYGHRQEVLSKRLSATLAGIALLLVVFVGMTCYTIRQNRRLRAVNKARAAMNSELKSLNGQLKESLAKLEDANLVKERYICRYLEVYREYIGRVAKMAKKAGEKDVDGFMKKEMQTFYKEFDHTFLTLYRNFVEDFNALLQDDKRIYPKSGDGLTTELRIFALIRLGIRSSAKIAELLCYSPNSIYNYRTRVKNAAKEDREGFEERVARL